MDREPVYPPPAWQREQEDCPRFRLRRVPLSLDKFLRSLQEPFHWAHFTDCRLLVLTMAFMWGRRHSTNVYRSLEVSPHRTRFTNLCLVKRWAPEAARRQQAHERRRALRPGPGETLDCSIDDSKKATRGKAMEAVAKRKDPTTAAYIQGHQYVCALLVYRDPVIPGGIRLYGQKTPCPTVGVPFRNTTEWAAQLSGECKPPRGIKVLVRCDAYDLCPMVVKACRAQQFHVASTVKSHRSLFKQGWTLTAGR